jgi:hypothetical protein
MSTISKTTTMEATSGGITPPHVTPMTDARSEVDSIPEPDLCAVDQRLVPIQEDLNEAAEVAMFPSPPINTPAFSPAPSVISRQMQRARGLSGIGDRLAQLSFNRFATSSADRDVESSTRSVAPSIDEEIETGGEVKTPILSAMGTIPIALGSPVTLPRYGNLARPSEIRDDTDGPGDGVTEKSIWADEVIADLERDLKRLEQVADDEGLTDEGKLRCYVARLQQLLEAADRKYPVHVKDGRANGMVAH